jgi:polyhydroxyalkanoate synthesis regulator phasin
MWSEGRPPRSPRPDMPPEMREMIERRMQEGRKRMEQAREKFRELEERVKKLEAEIERLKAA